MAEQLAHVAVRVRYAGSGYPANGIPVTYSGPVTDVLGTTNGEGLVGRALPHGTYTVTATGPDGYTGSVEVTAAPPVKGVRQITPTIELRRYAAG